MLSRPALGVSTWTFGDLPLVEIAQRLAAWQFDGVELWGNLDRYTAVSARQILQDHDLTPFAVSPMNVDLAHPDEMVRRQALDYYYRLLDFAAAVGSPLVVCRECVGRVRPLASRGQEREWLLTAVRQLADRAQMQSLRIAIAAHNRYETYLLNTGAAALALVQEVDRENVGVVLGAYHMNLEEQDASAVIQAMGQRLWLYRMADSNRQAIGRGHIKLGVHLWALESINYPGPIIFECMAPGPDPFTPIKDEASLTWLATYLQESRHWF